MPTLKQFQLFQPIGGVRQMSGPTTKEIVRLAWPSAFFAVNFTAYVPAVATRPVIFPLAESSFSPGGKACAAIVIGRSPVTGK